MITNLFVFYNVTSFLLRTDYIPRLYIMCQYWLCHSPVITIPIEFCLHCMSELIFRAKYILSLLFISYHFVFVLVRPVTLYCMFYEWTVCWASCMFLLGMPRDWDRFHKYNICIQKNMYSNKNKKLRGRCFQHFIWHNLWWITLDNKNYPN